MSWIRRREVRPTKVRAAEVAKIRPAEVRSAEVPKIRPAEPRLPRVEVRPPEVRSPGVPAPVRFGSLKCAPLRFASLTSGRTSATRSRRPHPAEQGNVLGTPRGGKAAHPRRGPAHRRQHRQAAKHSCAPSINVKHKVDLHLPHSARCLNVIRFGEAREHAAILLSSVRSRSGFSR
jgi:hypothetical protein